MLRCCEAAGLLVVVGVDRMLLAIVSVLVAVVVAGVVECVAGSVPPRPAVRDSRLVVRVSGSVLCVYLERCVWK